jgi:hypothetical protein
VSSDGVIRVAIIESILDPKTSASGNLMSLHSSQELSALSSKHRTHDDLYATFNLEGTNVL